MTCDEIYDELETFLKGGGEPYAKGLMARSLIEMQQLLETIVAQNVRIEGLLLENCDMRSRLVDANRLMEGKSLIREGNIYTIKGEEAVVISLTEAGQVCYRSRGVTKTMDLDDFETLVKNS